MRRIIAACMVLAAAGFSAWVGYERLASPVNEPGRRDGAARVVPVEVADVARGSIELRRSFTGTLTAHAEFVVAPKVSGRVERIGADLADTVTRGQVVAELDDAEYVQSVAQAQADWAVANANLAEAQAQLRIVERELARVERLRDRGVSSESQLDASRADQLTRQARVSVARAQVTRAEAQLEAARIRLGYTQVAAGWPGGSDRRVVAERYVDEGETVSANAPLLRIVELDPVTAVFFVTERDYALLSSGQRARLDTDAYPGEQFPATVTRIAPVFRENTRQARVELRVENPELRLKPGMFVRITMVLQRIEDATLVPERALLRRDDATGVFVLTDDGKSVKWRTVQVGVRDAGLAQINGEGMASRVVVLGQQLLEDGSAVSVDAFSAERTQ